MKTRSYILFNKYKSIFSNKRYIYYFLNSFIHLLIFIIIIIIITTTTWGRGVLGVFSDCSSFKILWNSNIYTSRHLNDAYSS